MSLSAPMRRFSTRCIYQRQSSAPRIYQPVQRRTLFQSQSYHDRNKDSQPEEESHNPILEEFKRKHPELAHFNQEALMAESVKAARTPGDIAGSSIFNDEEDTASKNRGESTEEQATVLVGGRERNPDNLNRVLNPHPNDRQRWERKKVIQLIRKNGRLSKEEILKKTEREHLAKSPEFKTSVKKLGMLARQIAGKTLDEAILQMRFSKKKVAQEVLKHLEFARDQAIVTRGMGLGLTKMPSLPKPVDSSLPVQIELKDSSKRHTVTDASRIYVDQAWVGRGPYGRALDHRARGNVNVMKLPFTALTVLLKEEATRVREYAEREEKRHKRRAQNVWVPMPERVIYGQRQWYSW